MIDPKNDNLFGKAFRDHYVESREESLNAMTEGEAMNYYYYTEYFNRICAIIRYAAINVCPVQNQTISGSSTSDVGNKSSAVATEVEGLPFRRTPYVHITINNNTASTGEVGDIYFCFGGDTKVRFQALNLYQQVFYFQR